MKTSYIIITDNAFDTDVLHFFEVGTEVVVYVPWVGALKAVDANGTPQHIRPCDVVEVIA